MPFLQRLLQRPSAEDLTERESRFVQAHFDIHAEEVFVEGAPVLWDQIDEVEVVKAARVSGFIGLLSRPFLSDDRYHVGVYFGKHYESVLPNVSLNIARHIVQEIAFHAPNPVRYKGIEGLSPVTNG
ncbi:MAG: hypothetical protein U0694_10935 [Anaerolineae bacterium]